MFSARKLKNEIRALGAVESAHNQGKLGSLLLARGRAKKALEPLEKAAAGEPAVHPQRHHDGQRLLVEPAVAHEELEPQLQEQERVHHAPVAPRRGGGWLQSRALPLAGACRLRRNRD